MSGCNVCFAVLWPVPHIAELSEVLQWLYENRKFYGPVTIPVTERPPKSFTSNNKWVVSTLPTPMFSEASHRPVPQKYHQVQPMFGCNVCFSVLWPVSHIAELSEMLQWLYGNHPCCRLTTKKFHQQQQVGSKLALNSNVFRGPNCTTDRLDGGCNTTGGTLIRALLISKVDYCISALAGITGHLRNKLQSVLNTAAWLVFSARKSEHLTPLLRELLWLRVPERIQFQLCVLVHRCLHGSAPAYLAESLHRITKVSARHCLLSADNLSLVISSTRRSTLGDRAFPVAASRAWNSLPTSMRSIEFLQSFCWELKTSLFSSSFD